MDEPGSVLRESWGIDAPLGPPHHGISRLTWRAGTVGWLAREAVSRLDETRSEARLLALLAETAEFAVPAPVPTLQGEFVATAGDYAWTLCRHIEGVRLGDEPSSYRRLVAILALVHRRLRHIDPGHAVMPRSLLGRARGVLGADSAALTPTANAAAGWLRGRIAILDALPQQIIHGDFGIPNVLVDTANPASFGILDWELSSCDSPVFDLAQIAFGMVAFSRHRFGRAQLNILTHWYAERGGQVFSEEQLATALVAGRLANIAWLQGRAARGETALAESVRFLDERLGRALRWLEQPR